MNIMYPSASALPAWLIGELRSDHAGETGAVLIYAGILATCRDADILAFAQRHKATEQEHLDLIETILPPGQRSLLLPIWRVAGWLTGALPGLFGRYALRGLAFNAVTMRLVWDRLAAWAERDSAVARRMRPGFYRGMIAYNFFKGCRHGRA